MIEIVDQIKNQKEKIRFKEMIYIKIIHKTRMINREFNWANGIHSTRFKQFRELQRESQRDLQQPAA